MLAALNRFIDRLSDFFAPRKGLLPMIGLLLVVINFLLRFLPAGWVSESDLFLHLGIILAIFGLLLARAL
jgi:hypothetical protein